MCSLHYLCVFPCYISAIFLSSCRSQNNMDHTTINMYQSDLKDRILEDAKSDQKCMEVKENFSKVIYNRKLKNISWKMMKFSCTGVEFMCQILGN
jgi:hypothetical protein